VVKAADVVKATDVVKAADVLKVMTTAGPLYKCRRRRGGQRGRYVFSIGPSSSKNVIKCIKNDKIKK